MPSDALVVDVSQDWAIACDVQERFMQSPGGGDGHFSYSGRCRQVRALGGRLLRLCAAAAQSSRTSRRRRLRQRARGGVDDSERAILTSHGGLIRWKRRAAVVTQ